MLTLAAFVLFCFCFCFLTDVVSKTMFKTENMSRFINFLSDNSCNDDGCLIDFDSLSKLNIRSVGVFGSKNEIIHTLKILGFGTTTMYVIHIL